MKKKITSIIFGLCLILSAAALCSCKSLNELKEKTAVLCSDGTITLNGTKYVEFTPADAPMSKAGDKLFLSGMVSVIDEDEPVLLAPEICTYYYTNPEHSVLSHDGRFFCTEERKDYLETSPKLDRIAISRYGENLLILPEDLAEEIMHICMEDENDTYTADDDTVLWMMSQLCICDREALFAEDMGYSYAEGYLGDDYENEVSFIIESAGINGNDEDIYHVIPQIVARELKDLIQ